VRNVTISLDDELARWLRVRAAEEDLSVSRFVAHLLDRTRESEQTYRIAMERALLAEPAVLRESPDTPLPKRSELYDR
jgi:plasmid stability protein